MDKKPPAWPGDTAPLMGEERLRLRVYLGVRYPAAGRAEGSLRKHVLLAGYGRKSHMERKLEEFFRLNPQLMGAVQVAWEKPL